MTRELLFEAVGEIDDGYVTEEFHPKKVGAFVKYAAAAACLVLAVAVMAFAWETFKDDAPLLKDDGKDHTDWAEKIEIAEYNGAYYDIIGAEDVKTMEKFNLPNKITDDMVGEKVGDVYSEVAGEFYRYLPYGENCNAVYLFSEDGATYKFALFNNFIHHDDSLYESAETMFELYGIESADDIASISFDGKKITSDEEVAVIYSEICAAEAMGNEGFQQSVFGDKSEEEQQKLHRELADNCAEVRIETENGVVIENLLYYRSVKCLYWGLNYYKTASKIG